MSELKREYNMSFLKEMEKYMIEEYKVGDTVSIKNRPWIIDEILDDGSMLVSDEDGAEKSIKPDDID